MNTISQQAKRCQVWLSEHALPRWHHYFDKRTGIFPEGIYQDGRVYQENVIRFRVQPRQLYVYAHATELGLIDARQEVEQATDLGFPLFQTEKETFVFSLDDELNIKNGETNAYEHAFALLGYAWHYRLTGEQASLDKMEAIYLWFQCELADVENGGFYSSTHYFSLRCQNPHMHLFEALIVCYEHTDDVQWLERASSIFNLFIDRFIQDEYLCEFFDSQLAPKHPLSNLVDPGHHYEWIWLLHHYQKLTKIDVSVYIERLNHFASMYGHNDNGLVRDEVKNNGVVFRSTSRLWCQTEYLKAQIALWERHPSPEREQRVCQAVDVIFSAYLNPAQNGLWFDQLDCEGLPLQKNSPASTFYHLFLAFSELLRVAK